MFDSSFLLLLKKEVHQIKFFGPCPYGNGNIMDQIKIYMVCFQSVKLFKEDFLHLLFILCKPYRHFVR